MDMFNLKALGCASLLATCSASFAIPLSSQGGDAPGPVRFHAAPEARSNLDRLLKHAVFDWENRLGTADWSAQYLPEPSASTWMKKGKRRGNHPLHRNGLQAAQLGLGLRDVDVQKVNRIPAFEQPKTNIAEPGVLSLLGIGFLGFLLARRISASH